MARNVKSFRVDTKKKVVVLFSNIKQTKADEIIIGTYLNNGYKVKVEKKTTVEMMRKELSKDSNALAEFNRLYTLKEEGAALGFHRACQYYTEWKKNKKVK